MTHDVCQFCHPTQRVNVPTVHLNELRAQLQAAVDFQDRQRDLKTRQRGGALMEELCLYFSPTMLESVRGKTNVFAVLWLVLLADWTTFGWILALVWAFAADAPKADFAR